MEPVNRAYQLMLKDAIKRLEGKDPNLIAKNSGTQFDSEKSSIVVSSLTRQITISLTDYTFSPSLGTWHNLVLLHYLDLADGSNLMGEYIPFSEITDGMIRGNDFDRRFTDEIKKLMTYITEDEFRTRCASLGAQEVKTNADLSVIIPFLPKYPILMKIWFADDEFPASGKLMVDKNNICLSIEDAVTVGEMLLEMLR